MPSSACAGPMGTAVDDHTAGSTDAFAAIMLERNGVFSFCNEPLVEDIEHFEETHVRAYIVELVCFKSPGDVRPCLTPDVESQFHYL